MTLIDEWVVEDDAVVVNSILGSGVTVGVGAQLDGDVIAEGDLVERPGAAAERRADESTS